MRSFVVNGLHRVSSWHGGFKRSEQFSLICSRNSTSKKVDRVKKTALASLVENFIVVYKKEVVNDTATYCSSCKTSHRHKGKDLVGSWWQCLVEDSIRTNLIALSKYHDEGVWSQKSGQYSCRLQDLL